MITVVWGRGVARGHVFFWSRVRWGKGVARSDIFCLMAGVGGEGVAIPVRISVKDMYLVKDGRAAW